MRFSNFLLLLFSITFFFGCQSNRIKTYDLTPVLVHLNIKNQSKNIGFNLPQEIPPLLYSHILSGKVTLWKDHTKNKKISASEFEIMESRSLVGFKSTPNLFFHEHWSINKKLFSSFTSGISFVGVDKKGEKLNFGYVEMDEVYHLLSITVIPNNANGNYGITFWQAIQSRKFTYNLVQFGKNDFKSNPKRSVDYVYQAEYYPRVKRLNFNIPEQKLVIFDVVNPSITSNQDNKYFYTEIEKLLPSNKHLIFNKINKTSIEETLNYKFDINSISLTEKWTKIDGNPYQEIQRIILDINNNKIELTREDLQSMEAENNQISLEEFIGHKSFDFLITKINHQEIKPINSEYFYNALLNNKWNQLY